MLPHPIFAIIVQFVGLEKDIKLWVSFMDSTRNRINGHLYSLMRYNCLRLSYKNDADFEEWRDCTFDGVSRDAEPFVFLDCHGMRKYLINIELKRYHKTTCRIYDDLYNRSLKPFRKMMFDPLQGLSHLEMFSSRWRDRVQNLHADYEKTYTQLKVKKQTVGITINLILIFQDLTQS